MANFFSWQGQLDAVNRVVGVFTSPFRTDQQIFFTPTHTDITTPVRVATGVAEAGAAIGLGIPAAVRAVGALPSLVPTSLARVSTPALSTPLRNLALAGGAGFLAGTLLAPKAGPQTVNPTIQPTITPTQQTVPTQLTYAPQTTITKTYAPTTTSVKNVISKSPGASISSPTTTTPSFSIQPTPTQYNTPTQLTSPSQNTTTPTSVSPTQSSGLDTGTFALIAIGAILLLR